MQTFNIPPQHELATVAVIVVREMIKAKLKYGIVTGVVLDDGRHIFQTVSPAARTESRAIGLKHWLRTYKKAKSKDK